MTKVSLEDLPPFGEFHIDIEGALYRNGKPVYLRPKVFAVLKVLWENRNRIVSYENIWKSGWQEGDAGRFDDAETHLVQTTVGNLLKRIPELKRETGVRIENFTTRGYVLWTTLSTVVTVTGPTNRDVSATNESSIDSDEGTIVLDGVTLNRTSELLYDTSATVVDRQASGFGYIRSLEDFGFASVFGGRILSAEVLPIAKGVEPFNDLQREFGADRFKQFSKNFALKPGDILEPRHNERKTLDLLVRGLGTALNLDSDCWREYAIREIRWIGSHDSLKDVQEDPNDYEFARSFWRDQELQESVPLQFLEYVMRVARTRSELASGIHDAALREYYSRNALAHILIFRWYQLAAAHEVRDRSAVFLASTTRACLLPQREQRHRLSPAERANELIWRVTRLVMPNIFVEVFDKSLERKDFRKWLLDCANDNTYREHRRKFSELMVAVSEDNMVEANALVRELHRLSRRHASEAVRCCRFLAPARSNETMPLAARQNTVMPEYLTALKRVFPELTLSVPRHH